MKITDRQGNEFEVVKGELPAKPFNIGRQELADVVAERNNGKCDCDTLDDVLTEMNLPNVTVETDDGLARVYAANKGVLALALERPNAAWYAKQAASAEAELEALEQDDLRREQTTAAKAWNERAAAVADGVKCTCKISEAVAKAR